MLARARGPRRTQPCRVHLVDISPRRARRGLAHARRRSPTSSSSADRATYEDGLAARRAPRPPVGRALRALPRIEHRQLRSGRRAAASSRDDPRGAAPGDALLLGADLVKPEARAAAGLRRSARRHGGLQPEPARRGSTASSARDFDLEAFAHRAVWNAAASRVEMHLVSPSAIRRRHSARRLRASPFAAGESIWTESSYKYDVAGLATMGKAAGFDVHTQWVDEPGRFALTLFEAR